MEDMDQRSSNNQNKEGGAQPWIVMSDEVQFHLIHVMINFYSLEKNELATPNPPIGLKPSSISGSREITTNPVLTKTTDMLEMYTVSTFWSVIGTPDPEEMLLTFVLQS